MAFRKVEEVGRCDLAKVVAEHLLSGYEVTQLEYDPTINAVFFTGGFGNYAQIRADGKGPCEILWRGRIAEYEDLPDEEWLSEEEIQKGMTIADITDYRDRLGNILENDDELWEAFCELPSNAEFQEEV